MQATQVYFEGRVQGVGFRYTVRRESTGFDLSGWVRNLPDGRVELVACGDAPEINDFVAAIMAGEMAGNITSHERQEIEIDDIPRGFEIRH